ncbi:MAG: PAS domain-containing protein [bacterium]|nr:PAS domain-containing protein [bacterium]
MKLTKILNIFILILLFSPVSNLFALPIDLTQKEFFARKGFSEQWINSLPAGDPEWLRIAPGTTSGRRIRIADLDLPGMPGRSFLSWKTNPPEHVTLVCSFELPEKSPEPKKILGIYLARIGINWEVYVNGNLVRREVSLSPQGEIQQRRNMIDVFIGMHSSCLKQGTNILAFRIIGDPAYIRTGLQRNGPYEIDEYDTLLKRYANHPALVLMFIYLFIGLYHLFLFLGRRKEVYNLFYGLFSFCLFIFLLSRSSYIYSIIPDTGIITRLELVALYAVLPFLGAFLDFLLLKKINKITIVCSGICLLLIGLTIPAPLPLGQDLLRVWEGFAVFFLFYYLVFEVGKACFSDIKKLYMKKTSQEKGRSAAFVISVFQAMITTVAGNLFLGFLTLVFCAFFDIFDEIMLATSIGMVKYGLIIFTIGITLVLANRFQIVHKRIETLNFDLADTVNHLNHLNAQISISGKKYRLLVEGTHDIIFTLDEKFRFTAINNAVKQQLKINPEVVIGKNFLDTLHDDSFADSGKETITRSLMHETLEQLLTDKKPVTFKAGFKSYFVGEAKQMEVRLEYVCVEGRNEILGKASSVLEDSLLNYLVSEQVEYSIKNYLLTADEISHRLTMSLPKYVDSIKASIVRISLREILINAIEHGNLDVSFEEKSEALHSDTYVSFITNRQNNELNANKRVFVDYSLDSERVVYRVSDEGKGFNFEKFMDQDGKELNEDLMMHGRGIMMAVGAFDEVRYSNEGSRVELVLYLNRGTEPPAK